MEQKRESSLSKKEFKNINPKIFAGRRRYYDKGTIELLKKIKFLLKDKGMTIKGANNILTNKDSDFQKTSVLETGLSDFLKLTVTVMKANFPKQVPKVFTYKNYKYFYNDNFRNDLMHEISKQGFHGITCEQFELLFMTTLNKHAPVKIKYIRANNSPFMNDEFSKAIMVRSKLRNKFLKLKTNESRNAYKRQRNYCVSLLREVKETFYENFNPKLISDNKTFWKQVKPFFLIKLQTVIILHF